MRFPILYAMCLLSAAVGARAEEVSTSPLSRARSDAAQITFTDPYVEPPTKLGRRGSVWIQIKNAGRAYLRSIKCARGVVAKVVFSRASANGLIGIQHQGVEISSRGLDLRPRFGVDFGPKYRYYFDGGHLIFSGEFVNKNHDGPYPPLECLFYFDRWAPQKVVFRVIDNIEDLGDF